MAKLIVIGNVPIHVEVPVFFVMFAALLSDGVISNLVLYKTCTSILRFNNTECDILNSNNESDGSEIAKIVEVPASQVLMARTLLDSIVPAFMILYLGTLSDRIGRRPILIISMAGFLAFYGILLVQSFYMALSPWYVLIAWLPIMATGKLNTLLTSAICYLSDLTSQNNKTFRLGIFDAISTLGLLLGSLSTSYFFNVVGYELMFTASAICVLIALLFTFFFVPESLPSKNTVDVIRQPSSSMVELFRVCTAPRPNRERAILYLTITCTTCTVVTMTATSSLPYMSFLARFGWSLSQYSLYTCAEALCAQLGTFFCVYILHRKLGVTDTSLILLGSICMIIRSILFALAKELWMVYLSSVFIIFGYVINSMAKSVLSKIASSDEIGKILAFESMVISIVPLVVAPVYTAIYDATVDINAGLYQLFSGLLYVICTVCICCIKYIRRNVEATSQYVSVNSDTPT